MTPSSDRSVFSKVMLATGLFLYAVIMTMPTSADAGTVTVAGQRIVCSGVRFRFDRELNNFGMYWPGLIKLNPKRLRSLPPTVQRFVVLHECGHRRHDDESGADCWAVQRGKSQGWLTAGGIAQICAVFKRHPKNVWRCPKLKSCYAG